MVLFIVLLWPLIRLVLTFPHAAVVGEINFGVSWQAMKGNFWRFILIAIVTGLISVGIYIVAALLIGLSAAGLAMLVIDRTPGAIEAAPSTVQLIVIGAIPIALIVILIGFFQAVSVTMLSFCYKALILRNYETAA